MIGKSKSEMSGVKRSNQNQANIILFLVSKNFIASDYINDVEINNGIAHKEKGQVRIVPILINYCFLREVRFANFRFF